MNLGERMSALYIDAPVCQVLFFGRDNKRASKGAFRKVVITTLLCATSVFSVSPWFNFPKKNNHRDTENTEVAQRSSSFRRLFGQSLQRELMILIGSRGGLTSR